VVVIVSEETGIVSLAEEGTLQRGFTPGVLRRELRERLTQSPESPFGSLFKVMRSSQPQET
jgi:hypothetical protein